MNKGKSSSGLARLNALFSDGKFRKVVQLLLHHTSHLFDFRA
jgi:hypothetical protein